MRLLTTNDRGITLVELILALCLLGIMVLAFTAITIFSKHHVFSADKRAEAQNQAALVLDHMNNHLSTAIGNERINGVNSVVNTLTSPTRVIVYSDANFSGIAGDTVGGVPDAWIGYQFNGNEVRYCDNINVGTGNGCSNWNNAEIVSNKIIAFNPLKLADGSNFLVENYIDVTITACGCVPAITLQCPYAYGTPGNPSVTMESRIMLPSVSLN